MAPRVSAHIAFVAAGVDQRFDQACNRRAHASAEASRSAAFFVAVHRALREGIDETYRLAGLAPRRVESRLRCTNGPSSANHNASWRLSWLCRPFVPAVAARLLHDARRW